METTQKSKEHILFAGPFEYFEIGGEVYRAPITDNVLDTQGYRSARRWECTRVHFERFRDLFV